MSLIERLGVAREFLLSLGRVKLSGVVVSVQKSQSELF